MQSERASKMQEVLFLADGAHYDLVSVLYAALEGIWTCEGPTLHNILLSCQAAACRTRSIAGLAPR